MPSNKKELQQALGTLGFWQAHIPGFGIIARPLCDLLKNCATWEWTVVLEAFSLLIRNVSEYKAMGPVILGAPFKLQIGVTEKEYQWGLCQKVSDKAQ